jgi:hypothetical protein
MHAAQHEKKLPPETSHAHHCFQEFEPGSGQGSLAANHDYAPKVPALERAPRRSPPAGMRSPPANQRLRPSSDTGLGDAALVSRRNYERAALRRERNRASNRPHLPRLGRAQFDLLEHGLDHTPHLQRREARRDTAPAPAPERDPVVGTGATVKKPLGLELVRLRIEILAQAASALLNPREAAASNRRGRTAAAGGGRSCGSARPAASPSPAPSSGSSSGLASPAAARTRSGGVVKTCFMCSGFVTKTHGRPPPRSLERERLPETALDSGP